MVRNTDSIKLLLLGIIVLLTISNFLNFRKNENLQRQISNSQQQPIKKIVDHAAQQAILNASKTNENSMFYKTVKTEAYCPEMVYIGKAGGGKFVCNPSAVKDSCTILSLYLDNQVEFDLKLHKMTDKKCQFIGVDVKEQKNVTKQKYESINGKLVTGKIFEEFTLPSVLKKLDKNEVELLNIDIEGAEHSALEPLIKDHFVCQMFIEVHGSPSRHLSMLQTIAKYGFRIFNVEENPLCPLCCEYSIINEKCMDQFGATALSITIP